MANVAISQDSISQDSKAPANQKAVALYVTLAVRSIVYTTCIFAFDGLVDFGTSSLLLSIFGILGIFVAGKISSISLSNFGALLLTVGSWILYSGLAAAINYIAGQNGSFEAYTLLLHGQSLLLSFLFAAVTTWLFLKYKHFLTFELILLGSIAIYLLSPHRDYHLDSPKFINSIAWKLGLEPQVALIASGAFIVAVLFAISMFVEPEAGHSITHEDPTFRRQNRISSAIAAFVFAIVCLLIGKSLYGRYDIQKGLTTNGVGEASEAGTSPLGFHSALGSTNQPAALVRLEGDYSQNPYTPMLYLREGALSAFNGHELVISDPGFDPDVPNIPPSSVYTGTEDKDLKDRKEVVQSVYLLADQKTAFAIDYPMAIKQLRNPDPERFKLAFRAYSLAPTFKLEDLKYEEVGDPRWSKELWAHYTATHPDLRYRDLALRLSADAASPVEKATEIINFLSKNSIYTLTPRHETKPDDDPVAPYLFGDLRGYCVHFAHATVYMLRALEIPARIGTGFMTDLSQSKDGHILLRMSDRHAWAEVYIRGHGWIPFDTQPEQVESAAESQVDMNLLEDLMAKLDPGEEILPKENDAIDSTPLAPHQLYIPSLKEMFVILGLVFAAFLLVKLYLHFGWILPAGLKTKLLRANRSLHLALAEIGFSRERGETAREFRARCQDTLTKDPLTLVPIVERAKYSTLGFSFFTAAEVSSNVKGSRKALNEISWWRRALGFLNPLTLFGRT